MINSVAPDIKGIKASSRAAVFRRPSEEIAEPAVLVQQAKPMNPSQISELRWLTANGGLKQSSLSRSPIRKANTKIIFDDDETLGASSKYFFHI